MCIVGFVQVRNQTHDRRLIFPPNGGKEEVEEINDDIPALTEPIVTRYGECVRVNIKADICIERDVDEVELRLRLVYLVDLKTGTALFLWPRFSPVSRRTHGTDGPPLPILSPKLRGALARFFARRSLGTPGI